MSTRHWIGMALILFISVLYGCTQTVYTTGSSTRDLTPPCETVDEDMQHAIESIVKMLQAEDDEVITDRVNDVLASTQLLEEEKNALEVAICVNEVAEDSHVTGKVNGYHSLLMYGIEMKKEEDIRFEDITFTPDEKYMTIQIEGTLEDSDEKVTINHYYANHAGTSYRTQEMYKAEEKLKERREESSVMLLMTYGISSSAYAVLQNPIEKLLMAVDSMFTDKAKNEQEFFDRQAANHASLFNMRFSLITGEKSTWEQLNMVEYYPAISTYAMIERANEVYEELPDYWYPKEEIEQGDWNGVVAYYVTHRSEMIEFDTELYEYIFTGGFYDSENFEELIQRVKDEHKE